MHSSVNDSEDGKAPHTTSAADDRKHGGFVTFPFIMATLAGLTLAAGGWMSNLIVYLIEEFNVKSISAAKIYNFVNGSTALFPIVGAIVADSFMGCFHVVWISSLISLLGIVILVLTATINGLRPPECQNGSIFCKDPSTFQYAVLYAGLALACIGVGGTRFTTGTMGANQVDKPKHKDTFFNWYIFTLNVSSVVGSTAIVYVEDNVSWGLGFGLCAIANILGLAIFLSGSYFYRRLKPEGTPFSRLGRVVVASILKTEVLITLKDEDYYSDPLDGAKTPTRFFKFLNRAAVITEGDTNSDGSIAKPWRLCTVQQVEDLKSLIRIFPLWSSGILLSVQVAIQGSMAVLQALTMDRRIGSQFKIPAGSVIIFVLLSVAITITVIDRLLFPMLAKFALISLTPLQRIGTGHVLTVISMVVSALVEMKRLKVAENQINGVLPIAVLWLLPQLAITGIGEAFHFPGQIAFYYQEFPTSLKSTSTAMCAMLIGIAFYLSNPVIDLVQEVTGWLPDNINDGRLDNVFWLCGVIGTLNYMYYLVCAILYKYRDIAYIEDKVDE